MKNATIAPSKGGFAVFDAKGNLIRDGFASPGLAAMWAVRRGFYKSTRKFKHTVAIPEELTGEQVFPLPFYARLQNRSYQRFAAEAKRGEWGPLLRISPRYTAIRFADYQRSLAQREIKPTG